MKPALMPRKEVMEVVGYKSTRGFTKFIQKYSDFPSEFRRCNAFNAHIFYVRSEVKNWLAKHNMSDALA